MEGRRVCMGMRRVAAIALIALATTSGCVGAGGAASSDRGGSSPTQGAPGTNVTITYLAPTCPSGGKCLVDPAAGFRVSRHLTCHPDGGVYSNPVAACHALTDIVSKLRQQQSQPGPLIVCRCPMIIHAPVAVGDYDGKRRSIQLDACSLCGLPVGADLEVLLPGAQG